MRIIVAYLTACTVAATMVCLYLLFEIDAVPEHPRSIGLLIWWVAANLGLVLGGAALIGGILAVPWLSMYFVFEVNPTRRNCILFGAGCGLVSVLIFQIASIERWPTHLSEIDLWRATGPPLLFTLAGSVSGLTYWAIAERPRT